MGKVWGVRCGGDVWDSVNIRVDVRGRGEGKVSEEGVCWGMRQ